MSGDLAGKRLELLKEAVPAARRIAVMMHPDEPIVPIQVRDISATAARIGVELEIISLRHGHELEGAFERAVHWRAQGLLRLAGQATCRTGIGADSSRYGNMWQKRWRRCAMISAA
jgi:putative ABC transport system substrate-binding protein